MDFSTRRPQPQKHLMGIGVVILIHVAVVYALVTGLGKKVIDVIRAPIETKVIEEIKKPPPPPEIVVPPPPQLQAPPPPYIPPPEVQIATPPPVQNTITQTTQTPPPAPVAIAPVAPPVVAPPAPPAGPVNARTVCSKMPQPELPGLNITGTVSMNAKLTISGGRVTNVEISQIRGTSERKAQRALAAAVEAAVREYSCTGDAVAVQEFVFHIN